MLGSLPLLLVLAAFSPGARVRQEALIEEAPDVYFRPPYVGGGGWVGVELSEVDDDQLGALVREAFQLVDAKDRGGAGSRKSSQRRRGS